MLLEKDDSCESLWSSTLIIYQCTRRASKISSISTGTSLDLVRTAKLVLDEYFSLSVVPLTADTQLADLLLPSARAVPLRGSAARGSAALLQESTCSTLSRSSATKVILFTVK